MRYSMALAALFVLSACSGMQSVAPTTPTLMLSEWSMVKQHTCTRSGGVVDMSVFVKKNETSTRGLMYVVAKRGEIVSMTDNVTDLATQKTISTAYVKKLDGTWKVYNSTEQELADQAIALVTGITKTQFVACVGS